MITPFLENLIHCGKAAFRSYPCALAGVYRLQIPQGHYIVITDIYFNDFNDTGDSVDFGAFDSRCNSRIYISSTNGNRLHLLHRSAITGVRFGINDHLNSFGLKHYAVYSIHAGTLKIGISILPPNDTMIVPDYSPLPVIAQEEPVNAMGYGDVGFGGANNANRIKVGALLKEYQPLTAQFTNAALPPNFEQYTPPVSAISNAAFGVPACNTALPLFNVCYTEIFEPLPEQLKF